MDEKGLDAAIDSWSIHAPDGNACVWMETRMGDAIHMTNLGRLRDVHAKLAEWCAAHQPH
jgi:hypothetical protein